MIDGPPEQVTRGFRGEDQSHLLLTYYKKVHSFLCQFSRINEGNTNLTKTESYRLSQKALGQTSIGQIINLMSNDVSRFDKSIAFMHYLLVWPVQVILVTNSP